MTSPFVGIVVVVGVVLMWVGHADCFPLLLDAQRRLQLQMLRHLLAGCRGRCRRGSASSRPTPAIHRVRLIVSRQRVMPETARTRPDDRQLEDRAVPLHYRPIQTAANSVWVTEWGLTFLSTRSNVFRRRKFVRVASNWSFSPDKVTKFPSNLSALTYVVCWAAGMHL